MGGFFFVDDDLVSGSGLLGRFFSFFSTLFPPNQLGAGLVGVGGLYICGVTMRVTVRKVLGGGWMDRWEIGGGKKERCKAGEEEGRIFYFLFFLFFLLLPLFVGGDDLVYFGFVWKFVWHSWFVYLDFLFGGFSGDWLW